MEQMTKQGVTARQFDEFWAENKSDLLELVTSIISDIGYDDRPFEDGSSPISITISVNYDCTEWTYQTGDNSYTGPCYMHPYWGVSDLYRDSDPERVTDYLIRDLADVINFVEE